jgi:MFS family permease
VVGCRIAFARLPDRVKPFRLGAAALAVAGVGLLMTALAPSVIGLYVGAAILAVGVAFITPAFFAAIFACVVPSERGAAAGTASVFLDVAFGGGPVLLGVIAGAAGIPAAFAVGASITLVAALVVAIVPAPRLRAQVVQD